MKLNNIRGFRDIDEYVDFRIAEYSKQEKNMGTLFEQMFCERDNIMTEQSDGFRIQRVTYGQFRNSILATAPSVRDALADIPQGSTVGLYMANSPSWIRIFWAILMCGYRPLLMNTRLDDAVLEKVLAVYHVPAVISDSTCFSPLTVPAADMIERADPAFVPAFADAVIFMSSGTSDNVKLCVYTGENFYYQICSSADIIRKCPAIKEHYNGELKQLALLPFYHVFGFIAVYIWFGFFSRTFVFLKDMNPSTLLATIKKHKVTHIFAVPLVWETVQREAVRKIRSRGEKTYAKFQTGLRLSNRQGLIGNLIEKKKLAEVRENLFGDSIKFLISGGSPVKRETLEFFNGIGYHMANGYGMTEIGITSVDISMRKKVLNRASIGFPFLYTDYKINERSELCVKGRTRASAILQNGETTVTDFDEWFATNDIVKQDGERYFIEGRRDDLIVCTNGENLNPVLAERTIKIKGCAALCIFPDAAGLPTLLLSIPDCYSLTRLREVNEEAAHALADAKLDGMIRNVVITNDPLLDAKDFKINRKKIARKYNSGSYHLISDVDTGEHLQCMLTQLEHTVRDLFAEALDKTPEQIGTEQSFFTDLGGSSLDYFTLVELVKKRFHLDTLPMNENNKLSTVKEFCQFISKESTP